MFICTSELQRWNKTTRLIFTKFATNKPTGRFEPGEKGFFIHFEINPPFGKKLKFVTFFDNNEYIYFDKFGLYICSPNGYLQRALNRGSLKLVLRMLYV